MPCGRACLPMFSNMLFDLSRNLCVVLLLYNHIVSGKSQWVYRLLSSLQRSYFAKVDISLDYVVKLNFLFCF